MGTSIQRIKVEGAEEAKKEITSVQGALDAFNETTDENRDAVSLLDKATGGAITSFKRFQKGVTQGIVAVKGLSKSFKGMKTALIATGIGAFVVALGLVVTYWDDIVDFITGASEEQQKLNDKADRTVELLDQSLGILEQQISIAKLRGESAKDLVKELRKELLLQQEILNKEIERRTEQLEQQKLDDSKLTFMENLNVGFNMVFNTQKGINNLIKFQNDESEEQKKKQNEITKLKSKSLSIDQKLARLDKEETDNKKKKLDDIKKIQDAEFSEFEKFLMDKEKLEDAYFQSKLDKETQEENIVRDKYFNLIQQAKKYGEDTTALEEAREAELDAVNEKFKKERDEKRLEDQEALIEKLAIDKENEELNFKEQRAIIDEREKVLLADTTLSEQQRTQVAKGFADARVNITNLENEQKEQAIASYANSLGKISGLIGAETQAGKLAASAAALIATYLNAAKARESQLAIATPDAPFRAAIAMAAEIAAGLANVKAINSVKVPNASGGSPANALVAPPAVNTPAFNVVGQSDTNQLTEAITGQTQEPVRAFVVSNDVTTAQSLDRNIVQGATIG